MKTGFRHFTYRVVADGCATSGLAVGTGRGAKALSEPARAGPLLLRGGAARLGLGDRNFGVWRLVRAAVQSQSQVRVRLTGARDGH